MWNGATSGEEFHSFSLPLHLLWGMSFISDSDGPQPVGAVSGYRGKRWSVRHTVERLQRLHPRSDLYSLKLGILRSRCGVDRIDHQVHYRMTLCRYDCKLYDHKVTDRVKVE